MPRGKYVNHKGRSRHFTSPEELQQDIEKSSEEETSSEEEGDANTAGPSKKHDKRNRDKKMPTSSEGSEEESEEEVDRDAKKGVAALIEIENPNRVVKKTTKKVAEISLDDDAKPELSRRDREMIEKERARINYRKMHEAGKTNEARADLARLAIIRQQRAEAAAKREAEKKALEQKKPQAKA